MENNLNLTQNQVAEIEALTSEQLKAVQLNIQSKDLSDEQTREAVAEYVADGGEVTDLTGGLCYLDVEAKILTDIAREAAISSFDAHGSCVHYRIAYDFIKSVLYDTNDDRYDLLPDFAPIGFRLAYAKFADCIEHGQAAKDKNTQ